MGWLLGAIDQAKLEEQRGVVLNEKRQGENQPYGKVLRTLLEGLFPAGHPYSWEVIGLDADVRAATLDDVKQWFRDYYGAANAVICLAGDIDAATALAKVERYFGAIPPGPPVARPEEWVPRPKGTRRASLQARVRLPMVLQAWNIPGRTSPDQEYLQLAGDVLSSGKSSRLYKRLVYDEQIAVSVSAYPLALEIAGGFGITALARPGVELARIEQALDEEVARFLKEGPTDEELRRVKNQNVAAFVRGAERIGGFGGKSDILCRSQIYAGDPTDYQVGFRRLQLATREDVIGAAREWLSDGKFVLTVQPFPDHQAVVDSLDRSQRPATDSPPVARFPAFLRTELPNGLKVLVAEHHAVPALSLRLVLGGGYAADPPGRPGLATMAMDMLDEGTRHRNALAISDALQLLGAELDAGANLDQCQISLTTLKSTLDGALDLYREVILDPAFPEAELARLKQERLAAIQQEKVTPNALALRLLPRLVYGEGHPYSAPLTGTGTEAATMQLTAGDLRDFHGTWFRPNNATLIVVGDTTADEILPRIRAAFSDWTRGSLPVREVPTVPLRSGAPVYVLDKPGAEQSVIFAAHLAPPKANPDERAIEMLNILLGGKFTSRINMNLREDKHWTYGAGTAIYDARHQRLFFAVAPVQTDKTAEAIREIRQELTAVVGPRPPQAAEVALTIKQAALELAGRWEARDAVADSLAELVRFDFPDDHFATYAASVQAQTVDTVTRAARVLVQPDRLVWVVVGDRGKIEAGLRGLEYGPVQLLDADGLPGAVDRQ